MIRSATRSNNAGRHQDGQDWVPVVTQATPVEDWAPIAPPYATTGRCGRPLASNHTGRVAALGIAADEPRLAGRFHLLSRVLNERVAAWHPGLIRQV